MHDGTRVQEAPITLTLGLTLTTLSQGGDGDTLCPASEAVIKLS